MTKFIYNNLKNAIKDYIVLHSKCGYNLAFFLQYDQNFYLYLNIIDKLE